MVQKKTLTNLAIYNMATALVTAFPAGQDFHFPVKINFFMQKNIDTITALANEIENARTTIIKRYGTQDEENPEQYTVPNDKIDDATNELNDLFNLEQEITINMLELSWFDEIELTTPQVSAISFMINEE